MSQSSDPHPAVGSGTPGLLRTWRAQAGRRLGLGKALTQADAAKRMGVSERWYRDMERGAEVRLTPQLLERLSEVLVLDQDEQMALRHIAFGSASSGFEDDLSGFESLRELLELQLPHPAYLSDSQWDIVGANETMAEWFPWVRQPGANLLRWVLTTDQAREQLLDWVEHAKQYLSLLRFAQARNPRNHTLARLADEVLSDPDCRRLHDEDPKVVAYRDGHHFRLRLPRFGDEVLQVVSRVLIPSYRQDSRFVVITRTDGGSPRGGSPRGGL
ncbi:helix-turn-helix transcriptional regulator [Streptomyces sp. TRM49041]|uniref:helix-turn-helix transcriptional regulator n=1 Tax=Streptomyces sp. TRM49041 TaxID=2603216 RepID=UPI0011EE0763|nr:helix-turn-helix transcriptional regulator [Streptomyces sp. TRM49041]